jgi:hypothetical protein
MSQARAANLAATLHVPGPGALVLLDSVLERMLDDAERPLLGNVGDATPHADMRTTVIQVLAIADSARSLAPAATRIGNSSGDNPNRAGVPACDRSAVAPGAPRRRSEASTCSTVWASTTR